MAEKLKIYKNKKAIVLAIPRGGLVVAAEIARALGAKLDIVVTHKLGAPWNPELAIGATAEDGTCVFNEDVLKYGEVSENFIENEKREQIMEIKRRVYEYRGKRKFPNLNGKIVIIVDDGIATGATVRAAIACVKNKKPEKIIIATPVCAADTLEILNKEADEVVVLEKPIYLGAIGEFYKEFPQVEDWEVKEILRVFKKKYKLQKLQPI